MKKLIYLVLGLLVIQVAQATPVMLATDVSYADILVASAAANKIGAEVYWVNNNTIPADIYSAIENITPEQVYIIGGPAVVSEEIETNLSANYNVTRIWGMTRYGTAAEVAKYFWEDGSERAVLVRDDLGSEEEYAEIVSKAKDIAVTQGIPLLLIPEDTLPAETQDALQTLGVKEVYLVGDINDEVKTALEEINISIIGEAKTPEEAEKQAIEHAEKIIIAAVGGWRSVIEVPFAPRGIVLHVRNESEIPKILEKVNEILQQKQIEEIKVVGIPLLADKVCSALKEQNLSVEVECITGKRAAIAKRLMEKYREEIKRIREKYKEKLEKIREMLEKRAENLKEVCEMNYEKAKSVIESLNETELSPVTEARFELIKAAYNTCINALENKEYRKAFKVANDLKHETRMLIWSNRDVLGEDIKEEIFSEIEDKKELAKKAVAIRASIEKLKNTLRVLPQACRDELTIAEKLREKGETDKALEHLRIAKRLCEVAKIKRLREISKRIRGRRACIQVITPAINPETFECKQFPTPCDVPEGWKIVRSCEIAEKAKEIATKMRERIKERKQECEELLRKLKEMKQEGKSEEEIREVLKEIKVKCITRPAGISPVAQNIPQPPQLPKTTPEKME